MYYHNSWPDLETQPADDTILRHEQIKMRVVEIEEVLKAMLHITKGEDPPKTSIHAPDFDWNKWRAVDINKPMMAGHSLGGCAAVSTSSQLTTVF